MTATVQDIAKHFDVSLGEVEGWIEQGALASGDLASVESWRASQEWARSTPASGTHKTLSRSISKQEFECEKLRAEAEKLRIEAACLRLRWWQKPAVLLSVAPIALSLAVVAGTRLFDSMNRELVAEVEDLKSYKRALETIGESGGSLTLKNEGNGVASYNAAFNFDFAQPPSDASEPESELESAAESLLYLEHVDELTIVASYYQSTRKFFQQLTKGPRPLWFRHVIVKGENAAFDTNELLPLQRATHLRGLEITVSGTKKPLDLNNVAKLRQLEALNLSGTNVNDDSIAELAGMHYVLRVLDLSNTGITSAGAMHLKNFHNLKKLRLENTLVDSTFVEDLKDLEKLEILDVRGTAVDDGLLEALKDTDTLKSLKWLYLTGTKVDEESVAEFRRWSDATRGEVFQVIYE